MQLQNKNILITGGAGFIASHLADALVSEKPASIVILDNFCMGKEENLEDLKKKFPNLKIYRETLTNYEKTKQIIKDNNIDIVYNMAVLSLIESLTNPVKVFNEIVLMAQSICELAREGLFDLLVHFSSSEVYGTAQEAVINEGHMLQPHTPYAAAKAAADHLVHSYCKTFNIKSIIIRPFNNYGPRHNEFYAGVISNTIKRILKGQQPIITGDGLQTRDFLYAADTAELTIKLTKCEEAIGKIINLGSGKEISVKDIVNKICQIMGYTGGIRNDPERPGDVRRLIAGTEKVKKIIDFEIKVDLENGLKKTIEWYKVNEK